MTAAFTSLSKSSTELGVKNSIVVLKQFVVIRYDRAIVGESIGEARKVLFAQKERMFQDILQQEFCVGVSVCLIYPNCHLLESGDACDLNQSYRSQC